MPLYNIMNRGLRLASLGNIRKGIQVPVMDGDKPKRGKGNQIVTRPKEMPHFVFKFAESTNSPTEINPVEQELYQLYGTNEIKALNVFLAYPDAFQSFSFWLEAYTFNQLIARSDERNIQYLFDVESQETLVRDGILIKKSSKPNSHAGQITKGIEVGQPVPHLENMVIGKTESDRNIEFKAVGRLVVVIKELRRLATFTLKTGGYWYDIPQIYSTIRIIDEITKATGRGANTIPLILRRVEREGTFTDDKGAKKKRVRHDVELEIRADIVSGLLAGYDESPFALSIQNNQPVLPSNVETVAEEDYADVVDSIDGIAEMSIDDAKKTIIVTTQGNRMLMGELSPEKLQKVLDSSKSTPEQKAAAHIILNGG